MHVRCVTAPFQQVLPRAGECSGGSSDSDMDGVAYLARGEAERGGSTGRDRLALDAKVHGLQCDKQRSAGATSVSFNGVEFMRGIEARATQNIADRKTSQGRDDAEYRRARGRVLWLLGQRLYAAETLRGKLRDKGFSPDAIDFAIHSAQVPPRGVPLYGPPLTADCVCAS